MTHARTSTPLRLLILALLVAAAAVWWLRLDTSSMPEVTRFRDDAYYYFAWARSLAAGHGPCVTPGVPTSGVHPMWGLLLAVSAAVAGPDALPIAAHGLGLLLHVATACALGWVLRRAGVAALCGALVYAGNPTLLTEAQNGQETALACLSAVLLLAAVRGRERWFMLAAWLATMARSDLFLLVPGLALWRHGLSWRSLCAPIVVLVAYAAINVLLAGHPLQDSAAPIPWLFEQHPTWAHRWWFWLRPCLLGGPWAEVSPLLASVLVFVAVRRWFPRSWRVVPLVCTCGAWALGAADLAVPLVAALMMVAISSDGFERHARVFTALLVGWAAIVFLHYVVRHYPRPYYFAPMGVAVVAALVYFQSRRPAMGAVLALAAAVLAVRDADRPAPVRRWQEESRMAALALPALVSSLEPIGVFNAGVLAYLRDGAVVNLDGVVNRPAFDAMRRDRLGEYLDQQDVRFVVDVPVQFALDDAWPHCSGRHFGAAFDPERDLVEIARFDVPGVDAGVAGTDALRLYWRRGRGLRPRIPERISVVGRAPDGGSYVLWPGRDGVTLSVAAVAGTRELARGQDGIATVIAVPTQQAGRYTLLENGKPALTLDIR